MEVKTRFAPSPTGNLHIGGVRTALYAYLIAKKNKGVFALRIEDTDRGRLVPGAVEDIVETLKWLGLNFDGEVILQSDRKKIYQEYAQKLLEQGAAYKGEGAVWFKTVKEGKTATFDLVGNRQIEFDNSTQDDFVILKSDGFPTYHLAHVVDDHLMQTNPVIRGAEWISSLPKHVMLFNTLGWEIPNYAHLPVILGPDKSKLSKRHGAKAVSEFRQDGFLAEAILNYMALLGWTPKNNREILSLNEMIKMFDLADVHLSNPVFDVTKLEWMNGEYIRKTQNSKLKTQILEYLKYLAGGAIPDHPTEGEVAKLTPLVKDRIKKLSDFIPLTDFIWEKCEYDMAVFEKLGIKNLGEILDKIIYTLEEMKQPWEGETFEKKFRGLADEVKISAKDMFQLLRVAVSGQSVTPPLFESIQILGEEETIKRVKAALSFLMA
ncbi:hypothetical protein A3B45_02950 [Candidatus Daviesbacteria bacterium RIFCSPLOWO2_01_FULL_39_12]|uniref:Glutamate--tRNA ligase n=1 Tax=Candidatus Daviesbacteria bacterium RIFCSPLOWO2_01_FULL_39_12 TaxID=1797785 RepID=A0A1F5KTN1_9BACT|nr:MAG: hypothetical protein A3B45_02950 [Candidatus Daviesbacteria bacterium RIFCSPLOWO2_01_FULL_39_12]